MRVCKSEKPEKTFKGFKRYICWIRTYVRNTKTSRERAIVLSQNDYDVYAFCLHVMEQDEMFYQQLTAEEIEALNYWRSHHPWLWNGLINKTYYRIYKIDESRKKDRHRLNDTELQAISEVRPLPGQDRRRMPEEGLLAHARRLR